MARNELQGVKVAVLATDGFEQDELMQPVEALRQAGADVEVLAPNCGTNGRIQAFHHHDKSIQVSVDEDLGAANPDGYDALLLPGGALNADSLRVNDRAREFVKSFQQRQKPIAAICHAPWLLASAGILKGRHVTSYHTIQDDLRNAGARWSDREVVVDGNLVTSRQPSDIPAFNRELIRLFSSAKAEKKITEKAAS
jgi:protease I